MRRHTGNLDSWAVNASFWDEEINYEGNDMYQDLVLPTMLELAGLTQGKGEHVLDLATGNRLGARNLRAAIGSGNGSCVIGSDGCKELL